MSIARAVDRDRYPHIHQFYMGAADRDTRGGRAVVEIVLVNPALLRDDVLVECERTLVEIQTLTGRRAVDLLSAMDFFFNAQADPSIEKFDDVRRRIYNDPDYPIAEHLIYALPYGIERKRTIVGLATQGTRKARRVLDVGIGPGVIMQALMAAMPGTEMHGLDVSASCASYAQLLLRSGCRIAVGDIREVTNIGDDYDLVVASEVIEHVEDPAAALVAIHGRMRIGGRLVAGVPTNFPMAMHLFNFDGVDHVLRVFRSAGFSLLKAQVYPLFAESVDVSMLLEAFRH
jgi:2-polyprenyl-3-methyl-5-hydroxy-6-metoxy-1,4-benzoquinol methylase